MDPTVPTQNPVIAQQPQAPTPKKSFLKIILVILFLVVLLSFLAFFGLLIYSDSKIPLISDANRQKILIAAYRIPLIPKTAEQILLTAVDSNAKLTTYSPEFSLSGTLGSTAIGAGSLDLKVKGPVDLTPGKKASFDLDVTAGVNFGGTLYEGSGKIRKIEDTVYGKVDNISDSVLTLLNSFSRGLFFGGSSSAVFSTDEIKKNMETVFANWISYDTRGIDSEARKLIDDNSQNQSIIDSTRTKTQDFLLQKDVLPNVKKLNDEKIDDTLSYHLQFIPTKDNLKSVLFQMYPEDKRSQEVIIKAVNSFSDSIESLEINVWFGKNDAILRKLTAQTQIKFDTKSYPFASGVSDTVVPSLGDLGTPKINLSTVLTIRDIGKAVVVEIPTPVKNPTEYYQMLSDSLKTEEQKKKDLLQKQYQEDFRTLGSLLLKYYVDNGSYPLSLNELDSSLQRLTEYTYKRSSDGKKFILYVEFESVSYYKTTPYYGISSTSTYPMQLSQTDFDLVQ